MVIKCALEHANQVCIRTWQPGEHYNMVIMSSLNMSMVTRCALQHGHQVCTRHGNQISTCTLNMVIRCALEHGHQDQENQAAVTVMEM
ncbi:hypothetical protein MAR_015037 [Mya arenaria]|uniref:Uncharacterized protein n=1 Tax=Mya arenaria TaxID=6604 RepID=A0ABY7FFU9_MYAAR|nr:hypothetical protein MAR_015037 [Mya arenaria]